MIAKRIRRGPRAPRGSVKEVDRFIAALTNYLVDANAADLVEIETGRRLTEYILDATGTGELEALGIEPGEKVLYSGTRNLIGHHLESWQAQMLAVSTRAVKCRDPIEHYVLSWQAGEQPTEQNFVRAVEVALVELGLAECQAIWAVHGNTDNLHVHVAVNRVHPITFKTLSAGDGWDKDRLQQICVLIENEGGWRTEQNALYVLRDGEVVHRATGTVVRDRDGRQTRARDRGNEPHKIPATFEPIVEAIAKAADWQDLHKRLHDLGARYERAGPGANIVRAGERIKPSKIGRDCSLPALERRMGEFEPSTHLDGFAHYKAQSIAERDRLSVAKNAAIAAVESWYATQMAGLTSAPGSDFISMLIADLAARKTAILTSIDVAFASADKSLRSIKSERSWIAAGKPDPSIAAVPVILLPSTPAHRTDHAPDSNVFDQLSKAIDYSTGWTEYRNGSGDSVLLDMGALIIVHMNQRSALEAGLLLAAGRWSAVKFTGDVRAAGIVAQLALRHGIRVVGLDGRVPMPRAQAPINPSATRSERPIENEPKHSQVEQSLPDRSKSVNSTRNVTADDHSQDAADDFSTIQYLYEQIKGKGR